MERVAFLIERSGERIGCMLNPASLVVRRLAGIRTRHSASGPLTGANLKDDPLIYTGGGTTELLLDLLFDVTLAGSSIASDDVRALTRPLFQLAEGAGGDDGYSQPPLVRFVWGKHWNTPGVVTAVAEHLEQFTPEGAPQRSWLRMRLVRVSEPSHPAARLSAKSIPKFPADLAVSAEGVNVHQVIGGGPSGSTEAETEAERPAEPAGSAERLDEIAHRLYGDCRFWRLIAQFNKIENPLEVAAGHLLRIPSPSAIQAGST